MIEFDKLAHPGMFAQIGEDGFVVIYRPTGYEASHKCISIHIEGVRDGEIIKDDSEFPQDTEFSDILTAILQDHAYLSELDFVPKEKGCCTRQVASIADTLMLSHDVKDIDVAYSRLDKIKSIQLPFDSEVWTGMANREGELLPVCCANISEIRDRFVSAQCEDGFMDAESIWVIVGCAESHPEMFEDPKHPVAILKAIWEVIEPVAHIHLGARKLNTDNVEDAVGIIANFANVRHWSSIYSSFPEFHDRVCTTVALTTAIPALKTLTHKIRELDLGPIEGWAICPRHGEDDIYETKRGLAVWPEREKAEFWLKDWVDTGQVEPEKVVLRAVRITIDKGIEFLGDDADPCWLDVDTWEPEVSKSEYDDAEAVLQALESNLKSERAKLQVRLALGNLRTMTEEFNPRRLRHERP